MMKSLARRLPDVPRWVEARFMLRSGIGELHGLAEDLDLSFVIRNPYIDFAMVVGSPPAEVICRAAASLGEDGEIAAPIDTGPWVAEALPEWSIAARRSGSFLAMPGCPTCRPAPCASSRRRSWSP